MTAHQSTRRQRLNEQADRQQFLDLVLLSEIKDGTAIQVIAAALGMRLPSDRLVQDSLLEAMD